jgi:hypothetical protein
MRLLRRHSPPDDFVMDLRHKQDHQDHLIQKAEDQIGRDFFLPDGDPDHFNHRSRPGAP